MKPTVYGYIRVSSKDQNEDRQVVAIMNSGVSKNHIYIDKQSGKNFDRPAYKKLISRLKPNDTLIIKSIDRLGRNYEEILEQWRCITKERGAQVVVLDMPILNTDAAKDLTGCLISDLILQLLSYFAQRERELIHERQAEGIAVAKAKGVKFGRPRKSKPHNWDSICLEWQNHSISTAEACKTLNISRQTFKTWLSSEDE